ncbi:MAG: N-acetylmuramic acid 6-phosphate etherase [Bacillota bacterium]
MGLENLQNLVTEQQNGKTTQIDRQSTEEILAIINEEDQTVPLHIQKEIPSIAEVVDSVVESFEAGGRLFYVGAGTSGRIGILDASECPPTYGTPPEMVKAIIAGGEPAIFKAVEGAEDSEELGANDIKQHGVRLHDVVIGITASGRAPYVIGALKQAKELGAKTVSFTCTKDATLNTVADYKINIEVGPEVITGSTRMKAGTTQKLVLNMITTTSMVKIGKVFNNLMVDVQPLNKKLVDRAKRIIQQVTGCSLDEATTLFDSSEGNPKVAIIMYTCQVDAVKAAELLSNAKGFVYKAIKAYNKN